MGQTDRLRKQVADYQREKIQLLERMAYMDEEAQMYRRHIGNLNSIEKSIRGWSSKSIVLRVLDAVRGRISN